MVAQLTNATGAEGRLGGTNTRAPVIYVDTVNGQGDVVRGAGGLSNPYATMEQAFEKLANLVEVNDNAQRLANNATIYAQGVVAEQLLAPLGASGVRIVGVNGGGNRHDNGFRWKEAASAGAKPLLELREQGWEVHHALMVPQTGYSAVKLHREETVTYPDASHAVFGDVRFIGNAALGTAAGMAIEDYGGAYDVTVDGCQFVNLIDAIKMTNAGIAAPLMWRVGVKQPNIFQLNTNDISVNASGWELANNQFLTPYNVTTHPITVNLAFTGTTTYANRVFNNAFADAAANVVIAKGYVKGNTGDVWRNFVTDTAAYIVAVPA